MEGFGVSEQDVGFVGESGAEKSSPTHARAGDLGDDKLYNVGLLAMCEALHHHHTGSDGGSFVLSPWSPERCLEYLRSRLASWRSDVVKPYDEAVRALVRATLNEAVERALSRSAEEAFAGPLYTEEEVRAYRASRAGDVEALYRAALERIDAEMVRIKAEKRVASLRVLEAAASTLRSAVDAWLSRRAHEDDELDGGFAEGVDFALRWLASGDEARRRMLESRGIVP